MADFNGDAPEPAPACERTSDSADGHSGRFRIRKTDDPFLPWHMDYPETADGRLGITFGTFEAAVAAFIEAHAAIRFALETICNLVGVPVDVLEGDDA